jgi:hypothetical protein
LEECMSSTKKVAQDLCSCFLKGQDEDEEK